MAGTIQDRISFGRGQSFHFSLRGAEQLQHALRELGSVRRIKTAISRTSRRVLEPIAEATRAEVPRSNKSTGLLAGGVAVVRLTRRQGAHPDTVSFAVGFTGPHRSLAHLWEFGFTRRGRSYPGKGFLRLAWDGGKGKMLDDYQSDLWAYLERAAKRARRGRRR